jgi:hypothetical protein
MRRARARRGEPSTRREAVALCLAVGIACGLLSALASGVRADQPDATGGEAYEPGAAADKSGATDGEQPIFSVDSPVGPIEYFPARGLHVGRTGLRIGGFSTLELDREDGKPAEISLDSVNFLVSLDPIERLHLFAELEVGGLFSIDTDGFGVSSSPDLTVERLYGDLSANDALNLRVGKFQTPVGIWNQVPAEPFVWTAQGPVTIEEGLDEFQTGVAVYGSFFPGVSTLSYWLYGQVVDSFDAPPDEHAVYRSAGGRLEYGSADAGWSVGGSVLGTVKHGEWSELGGLDAQLRIGPLELTSEALIQRGDIPHRNLWGAYLQGVYHLESLWTPLHGVYAVGRVEHFDKSGPRPVNLGDVGLAWLPVQWLNIKADYRFADRETDQVRRGFFASLSVLF